MDLAFPPPRYGTFLCARSHHVFDGRCESREGGECEEETLYYEMIGEQ